MDFTRIFKNMPVVTKNLIIINVLVWVAMAVLGPRLDLNVENYLGLHYFSSTLFNPAQLLTYMFLHANFMHLFFNMFALFMFGIVLERVLGSKRFLFYFISCGIGAGLIQEGVYAWYINDLLNQLPDSVLGIIDDQGVKIIQQGMNYVDPQMGELNALFNGCTIGASGAVYGILLAFGVLFPNQPIYLMIIPIPIPAKYFVIGYGLIEFYQGFYHSGGDNVAHFAHLGGMLFGLIMILYWKKKGSIYGGLY